MLYREEKRTRILLPLLILIFGGLLGSLVGKLLGILLPEGVLYDIVSQGVRVGLQPPVTFDLWITSITLGFTFQMNACGGIFIILLLLLYKKA